MKSARKRALCRIIARVRLITVQGEMEKADREQNLAVIQGKTLG
jgi:hypothetical protein